MSYRSIKRVLGETSLERKCRLLFGVCLLFLIGSAFWGVDRITGQLVLKATRNHGHDLVNTILIKIHAVLFQTDPNADPTVAMRREWLIEMINDFEGSQEYGYEVVALDQNHLMTQITAIPPRDAKERELLIELDREFKHQAEELARQPDVPVEAISPEKALDPSDFQPSVSQVFKDRPPEHKNGEYHYFEPVIFTKTCSYCHHNALDSGTVSAAEIGGAYGYAENPPLFVMKVILPYGETKDAVRDSRAILIAVAILTVFVAMITLYLIVRYVIVKPLKHLRQVSDDVSRGKMEVRADIHTNDEFEDLAHSFNRMLRHLTDAQAELRRVNTDLDGKVDELAQLNMRLYEMNRLKDDFLANMSHELRTPLNSIIGFSEVLQGIDALNVKQKRYAGNIQKSGRLLLEMINDILDLAKMEAGKMEVRASEFPLDTIVQAQCDLVRALAEDKNIDLVVDTDPNLPPVYQDRAKVQQILTNLLSNAIKFTPEGGRIDVRASRDPEGRLALTVIDTGVGIADEDRDIIFEKFRQSASVLGGDALTREYSGTGLGLSILKELCKLLQGEIEFESELGKGSAFRVILPWTSADRSPRERALSAKLQDLTLPKSEEFTAPERRTPDDQASTTPPARSLSPSPVADDVDVSSTD